MPSKPWSATAPEPPFWVLRWDPKTGLGGSSDVVASVVAELSLADEILVTPTGPSVPSTPENALAVRAALARVRPAFLLSERAPEIPEVPEGAAA